MILPPFLKKGDTIGIISSAGIVNRKDIHFACEALKSTGFKIRIGKTVGKIYNTYAGNDEFRLYELQQFIDDQEIKAVLFARGGYGTSRIIDRVDFSGFIKHPKWLAGFSDMTVLHNHIIRNFNIAVIHGPMAKTIRPGNSERYLTEAFLGKLKNYSVKSNNNNIPGNQKGVLVGGNLSLLNNISGSKSDFNPVGKILFIEETSEYYYHIDRMLWGLKRSKDLSKLKGVITGHFSRLKDNKNRPFGKNIYDIILDHFGNFGIPVIFDFPAGHDKENYSLYMGRETLINSGNKISEIVFL